MLVLGIRFDFRNPAFAGTTMAERYRCALEQCEWADRLGFDSVTLSEHHGSDDGYLPSPLAMAAAIAARTERLRIRIAALVAPLHDPLRVAEDAAVVDQLSGGRLDLVLTNGYVPSEFAMFGRALSDRARLVTEAVETLRHAWTGEPFEHRGRTVRVTPTPFQQAGPPIWLGGSSDAAARRAARIADMFLPSLPEFWESYRDELRRLGRPDVGPMPPFGPSYVHVTDDPDATWHAIAPYALHEMNAYGAWAAESGAMTGYEPVADLETLRASGMYRVVTPDEHVAAVRAMGDVAVVTLHPLMGGVPPALAWENLRAFEDRVLPRLR